jgi:hypothetical protein
MRKIIVSFVETASSACAAILFAQWLKKKNFDNDNPRGNDTPVRELAYNKTGNFKTGLSSALVKLGFTKQSSSMSFSHSDGSTVEFNYDEGNTDVWVSLPKKSKPIAQKDI